MPYDTDLPTPYYSPLGIDYRKMARKEPSYPVWPTSINATSDDFDPKTQPRDALGIPRFPKLYADEWGNATTASYAAAKSAEPYDSFPLKLDDYDMPRTIQDDLLNEAERRARGAVPDMRAPAALPEAPSPASPAGEPPALPGPEPAPAAPAAPAYRGRPLYVANPNDTYLEDSYGTDWARDLRAQGRLRAPTRLEQAVGAAAASGGVPPDLQAALDAQDAAIAKRRRDWLGGRTHDDALSYNDRLGARAELARAEADLAAARADARFAMEQDAATGRAAIEAAGQAAAADAANAWRLPSAQAEAQGRVDAATAQAKGATEAARLRAQGLTDAATAQAKGRTAAAQARADALRDAARIQQQRPVYGNDGKTAFIPEYDENGNVSWRLQGLPGAQVRVVGDQLVIVDDENNAKPIFDGRQDPAKAALLRRLDVLQRAYAAAAGKPEQKAQADQLLKDINALVAELSGKPAPEEPPKETFVDLLRRAREELAPPPAPAAPAPASTFWAPGQ